MLKSVHPHEQSTGSRRAAASSPASSGGVKSAIRILDILELLGGIDTPLTLTEVSAALGLPKSSTSLLLQTLAHRGYLEAVSPRGPFKLGLKAVELGAAYTRRLDLVQQFGNIARQLVVASQETVQLAVLDGTEIVYLAKEDGTMAVRLVSYVGKRLPAHATALGKVLLASLPESELVARLGQKTLVPMTPRTVSTFQQLSEVLAEVREQGYGVDREEAVEDLYCFAAPVWDQSRKTVAAISVSVPKSRVTEESFSRYAGMITNAGFELSRRMGYLEFI